MSYWTRDEQSSFTVATTQKVGQLTAQTEDGASLIKALQTGIARGEISTVVEIGTWNGYGSTTCILNAIEGTPVSFWSLECNKEKLETAKSHLHARLTPSHHLLHGTIINPDSLLEDEAYFDNFPDMIQEWFISDMNNCRDAPNVLHELPEEIDMLVLDGGEYTTLAEFHILFPRCRQYIVLDDTFTDKCKLIRTILLHHPEWQEEVSGTNRGGFSIFKRVA